MGRCIMLPISMRKSEDYFTTFECDLDLPNVAVHRIRRDSGRFDPSGHRE